MRRLLYTSAAALLLVCMTLLPLACASDSYETGEGAYSRCTAEMVTFPLDERSISVGELDDSRQFRLSQPLDTASVLKAFSPGVCDGKVRMMLFFSKQAEDDASVTGAYVGGQPVFMTDIALSDTVKSELRTDPLTLKSAWMSRNGQYLNLYFAIKTGKVDGKIKPQPIGIVCDGVKAADSGEGAVVQLRLIHDQKGSPELYSSDGYFSVSRRQLRELIDKNLPEAAGGNIRVCLEVNTYDGKKTPFFDL